MQKWRERGEKDRHRDRQTLRDTYTQRKGGRGETEQERQTDRHVKREPLRRRRKNTKGGKKEREGMKAIK